MVTVGFWQNLFKGSYGRVAAGLQWEYIQHKSFDTVATNAAGTLGGGAVSTSDNVFLTSLRYYPFRRQHLFGRSGRRGWPRSDQARRDGRASTGLPVDARPPRYDRHQVWQPQDEAQGGEEDTASQMIRWVGAGDVQEARRRNISGFARLVDRRASHRSRQPTMPRAQPTAPPFGNAWRRGRFLPIDLGHGSRCGLFLCRSLDSLDRPIAYRRPLKGD